MELVRTDASHPDFIGLVRALDTELAIRDGEDHAFYHQFNAITHLKHCIIMYHNGIPLGCGAIKPFDDTSVEVKRMFTTPESRGKGLASELLNALEQWATELGYSSCVLETGLKQPEAIALYTRNNYERIPNYGQYINVTNSLCFKKVLK
ncbi:GNAT family N-acetyltransferase [Formosa sp. A9]|uniref:GNAT family N-acetyltransferase n=1 Tax=Formosa sp. A9 TaxID=3442641 RepID=UPI003EBE709D